VGKRRQLPREHEREVEVVGRVVAVVERDDDVFERQEHAWIDLEGEVEIERTVATVFRMQVDLPRLTERVGLDEMALVVDVEGVVDGMLLELGYIAGDIDRCHRRRGYRAGPPPRLASPVVTDDELRATLVAAVGLISEALHALDDRRPVTEVAGQYALDVVTDAVVVPFLVAAGLGVLSEESGLHHPERDVIVVVDPVDGSTNASRHLPWFSTSLCALDDDGPRVSVVSNLATGETFDAVRGRGARCDGLAIRPSDTEVLAESVIVVNGLPDRHWGWYQYRALGSAALDLCAVAAGRLDAFVDLHSLAPWDYLGALLVCREAGAVVVDAAARELVTIDATDRRAPMAAATRPLLDELQRVRGEGAAAS
jgi:myo-inositol-1(or 4)-monophosphatase